jgi:hypothetical protein
MSVEAARLIAFDPEFKAIVEAQDWDGPDFKTCANAASVARAFETSRRRERGHIDIPTGDILNGRIGGLAKRHRGCRR